MTLKAHSHNATSYVQHLSNLVRHELTCYFGHNGIKESYNTNCIGSCEPAVVGQLLS